MSIGTFGSVTFEASTNKTRTFDDFKRTTTAKYEEHTIVGQKPLLEFLAPGLDAITFQIVFSVSLGLNPAKEVQLIRDIVQKHQYYALVIGSQNIGNFVIESLSEIWRHVDGNGNPFHIALDVTMKEYIESSTTASTINSGSISTSTTSINSLVQKVQSVASGIGLEAKALPNLAKAALTATKDRQAATSSLSSILTGVSGLQSVAASVDSARNKDVSGILTQLTGNQPSSYQILGLNVADLVNKSTTDPSGAIIDILSGLNGGGETSYTAARQLYGAKNAGTIMQMAGQVTKITQALKG